MSTQSKIEWTEQTWNPTVGCTKVSPGCKNCYAESMSRRLKAMGVHGYENGFRLTLMPDRLAEPLERRKPTVYFVNSMSDLFHEKVPFDYVRRIFDVMRRSPQHTFQVLTKRAERMADFCRDVEVSENVWLGVSVENRRYGVPRIPVLRTVRSAVRFLSVEPLLEDIGTIDLKGIQWVIVGGESGNKARPMKPSWVQNVKHQCEAAGVAFFFKQWGTWGADGEKRSKGANGRQFDGRVWDEMPQPVHAFSS
jgi:protein gp37